MPRTFYDLWDDKLVPGRWYLNGMEVEGRPIDNRIFRRGVSVEAPPGPVLIRLRRPGDPLDFTFADNMVPIVSERTAAILERIASADIQLVPAAVDGHEGRRLIVVARHAIDCVDETASEEVRRFTLADERPDMLGKFKFIGQLKVDLARAGDHHLFRVKDWEVALIASQEIKDAFDREQITGRRFVPV